MDVKGLIDCHTHTGFSVDSEADINEMIERAIDLGLSAYAITDHCECNRWYGREHYINPTTYLYFDFGQDYLNSVAEITKLKEKYSDKIELICGVELGQANQEPDLAQIVVDDRRVDFIIGSLHQLYETEDFALIDYSMYTHDEVMWLLDRYYVEVLELAKLGKFDVLGHLTYTLRYIEGNARIKVDLKKYDDIIDEIFKTVIYNGKGIEINTSGLRQKYGKTFPDELYVKRYRELGGEILSLGSDSHCVQDIGKGIEQGAEIAKKSGFKYVAYFKEHKPVFIKL